MRGKRNYLGLQKGKPSLNNCVPVWFRVSRRAKREKYFARCGEVNVLLKNYKHDIRI